ncbi:hypothetical protein B0H65DRAFT_538022 [Neurospora tetraspora]|uniref:Prion-inhibition and propagation HeLo domain-containing protein n=1 Tax=Neurospora tetraspora TaxID=94610 RepID=A0AAE0JLW8_9PEZI|nr:hypothetical protein B0H65DRAFT_538022 [Neurospora tetraspora]
MSGFEVAGLVLGALPLIISALEGYAKGAGAIQQWRFYTRELRILKRGLETEHVKLQNVCEKLLMGIAQPPIIEKMIENTFGPLWKEAENPEIYHKIRQRLWRAARIFEENVKDMNRALQELQEKLNVGPDGQPRLDTQGVSFRKELKRLSFALNKSVYLELLTRIRDGVSSLEALTSQNSDLEPERNKRSNGRLYRIMHSLSGGIYQALCTAMTACQCPTSHLLGLKLSSPPHTSVIPDDEDEDVVRNLSVKLAVSDQNIAHGKLDRLWCSLVVKPSSRPRQSQIYQQPTAPVESERPTKRARKTVMFSFSENPAARRPGLLSRYSSQSSGEVEVTSRSSTQTLTLDVTKTKPEASNEDIIMDLCETVRQLPSLQASGCCGHITGPAAVDASATERYGLYALGHLLPSDSFGQCSFISLHEVLTEQLTAPAPFYDEDRLRLAYILASSVLQLAGTPWLTTKVTTKDIFLIRCNGTTHLQEAIVVRQLPAPSDLMQLDAQPPQDYSWASSSSRSCSAHHLIASASPIPNSMVLQRWDRSSPTTRQQQRCLAGSRPKAAQTTSALLNDASSASFPRRSQTSTVMNSGDLCMVMW